MIHLTWLIKALLFWAGFSIVATIGCAWVLQEPEDTVETMRAEVLDEIRSAATWN